MKGTYNSPYGYYLEKLVIDAKTDERDEAGVAVVVHRADASNVSGLALPVPTGILVTTSDFPFPKTFVAYENVRGIKHR